MKWIMAVKKTAKKVAKKAAKKVAKAAKFSPEWYALKQQAREQLDNRS